MSDIAVRVEGLGKRYQIGKQRHATIGDRFRALWTKSDQVDESEFWALKDVSFEIKKGEAVGIIGKNGAGKSTLLKVLSKITYPTTGRFEMNGRVSSLLEVGTGFHPELTGRENVFLNGTILGMTRSEIKSKFDEIVAFSGVEKFLDTPVKHYSSGMYVRLAFSVAAHLEPEILIIDEVLAVGDAEFQKKCLGKMDEVAKQGRTVLFVSHNMGAIRNLCSSGILLSSGEQADKRDILSIIDKYLIDDNVSKERILSLLRGSNDYLDIIDYKVSEGSVRSEDLDYEITFRVIKPLKGGRITITIEADEVVLMSFTNQDVMRNKELGVGLYKTSFKAPLAFLNLGKYRVLISAGVPNVQLLIKPTRLSMFEIVETNFSSASSERKPGYNAFPGDWNLIKCANEC